MLVKELRELISDQKDYMEVMIDSDGYLFDISRTLRFVNLDSQSRIVSELNVDDSFTEKESVLVLSTF